MSKVRLVQIALLMLVGCQEKTTNPSLNVPEGTIWPLAEGNSWAYGSMLFDEWYTWGDSIQVLGRSTSLGTLGSGWFDIVSLPRLGRDYFKEDSKGILIAEYVDSTHSYSASRFLLYPAQTGQQWSFKDEVAGTVLVKFEGYGRSVSVPAGNFGGCAQYRFIYDYGEQGSAEVVYYFRAGVGPVKWTDNRISLSGEIYALDFELVRANLAE